MRKLSEVTLVALALSLAACGAETSGESQTVSPPVAVWRPDSAANAPADSPSVAPSPPPGATPAAPAPAGDTPVDTPAPTPAPGEQEPEARSVLLRAERAYDAVRTLQADFVQDLTVPLLDSSQRSRGVVYHRKPDRFLMRFSDPAGDVVVADGRALWLYYPSNDAKQVIRTSMGAAGSLDLQREFLSNPTERFDATLDGSESVAGRGAKVLTLVPRDAARYKRVRIWIDDRDSLARKFEIVEQNDAVRVVELRNLQVNATLGDELFTFTVPAGAQVFDQ